MATMDTTEPVGAARVARQWFYTTFAITLVVLALYAGAAAIGVLSVHPLNVLVATVPATATGITLVVWRLAQLRVDTRADAQADLASVRAELAEMRTAVITAVRAELAGFVLHSDDTQPLPRAVGTAYIGGGWQAGREVGIVEGYEQGINAAPEGGATVLQLTNHRR